MNGLSKEKERAIQELLFECNMSLARIATAINQLGQEFSREEQFNTELEDGTIVRGGVANSVEFVE